MMSVNKFNSNDHLQGECFSVHAFTLNFTVVLSVDGGLFITWLLI